MIQEININGTKVEVGQVYLRRDGGVERIEILSPEYINSNNGLFPIFTYSGNCYSADGLYFYNHREDTKEKRDEDLVRYLTTPKGRK